MLRALNELGSSVMHSHENIINQMNSLCEDNSDFAFLKSSTTGGGLAGSQFLEIARYLKDKNLIELDCVSRKSRNEECDIFIRSCKARITAHGLDIIEDDQRLDKEIPIPQNKMEVNIHGDNKGPISQNGDANVNIEKIINGLEPDAIKELLELKNHLGDKSSFIDWLKSASASIPAVIQIISVVLPMIKDKI
jgi:hypothetical protein